MRSMCRRASDRANIDDHPQRAALTSMKIVRPTVSPSSRPGRSARRPVMPRGRRAGTKANHCRFAVATAAASREDVRRANLEEVGALAAASSAEAFQLIVTVAAVLAPSVALDVAV